MEEASEPKVIPRMKRSSRRRHRDDRGRRGRKKRRRRVRKTLPNVLFPIKNPDKGFHERWTPGRNCINIPHPFRCLLLGPPNSGKTNCIKHIMMRCKPAFERVVIVHCTPDLTNEYQDCAGAEIVGEIPPREFFDDSIKNLVILEDLDFGHMGREQATRLDRLYGNWSTHGNISICSTSQDFYNMPAGVRRCTNFFVLWKPVDENVLPTVARRVGVSVDKLSALFTLCPGSHDSVWVDKTDGTPYPIRINAFDIPITSRT